MLIGVTAFFRDPEAFEVLAAEVLPRLFEKRTPDETVRIWTPGCASGEEAYTLAMLCCEHFDTLDSPPHLQIFASDIDERALQRARAGEYPVGIVDHVSPERLQRFFVRRGKRYQVTKELRELVLFSPHNLISDPPFSRQDLICCRNLLIYLGPHLQKKLIPLFHYALRPSGYLFLGPSETIASHGDLFRVVDAKHRISQRKGTAVAATAAIAMRQGTSTPQRTMELPSADNPEDLLQVMQRIVLDEFAPKSVVVDEDGQVLCASADMQKYLSVTGGAFQNNVIKMAQPGLRIGLRSALSEAKSKLRRVDHDNLSIKIDDKVQRVLLTVQPMPRLGEEIGLFIVVFHDVGLPIDRHTVEEQIAGAPPVPGLLDRNADAMIAQLEAELETTRSDLERSMQDMEAANEELKSSNEELLSMNEELQSANEELETSKEEIRAGSDALASAHNDLENLLRSTQIAVVFLDADFNIRSFTPAVTEIYGLIATDIGRPLELFKPLVEDMPPLPHTQTVQADRPIEHTVRAKSGKWYIRRVLPYQSQIEEDQGIVVTFTDITDRRHAQLELEARERRLKTITDAIPPAIAFVDTEYRVQFANAGYADQWGRPLENIIERKVREIVGDKAWVEIEPHLQIALGGEKVTYDLRLCLPHADQVLHKEVTYVPEMDNDGEIVGVHVVITDVTDRKRHAEQLADRETHLRRVIDHMLGFVGVLDCDGILWEVNETAIIAGGVSRDDVVGKPFWECYWWSHDEQVAGRLQQAIQKTRAGEIVRYDVEVRMANDTRMMIDFMLVPVRNAEGEITHLIPSGMDISERKAAEEQLRDREAHLRRVINNQLGLVGVLDRDGKMVEIDDDSLKIAGLTREDVIGKHFAECDWWTYDPAVTQQMRDAMDRCFTGEVVRFDVPLYAAGMGGPDERLMIDFMMAPVFDADGNVEYLIPSGVDISERYAAEQELARAKQRLDAAMSAGNIGLWNWEMDTNEIVADASLKSLFGFDVEETPPLAGLMERVDEADRERVGKAVEQAIQAGGVFLEEYRVNLPTGEQGWFQGRGRVVSDSAGNSTDFRGVVVDITDRKRAEEALKSSEERLRIGMEVAEFALAEIDYRSDTVHLTAEAAQLYGVGDTAVTLSRAELHQTFHGDDQAALQNAIRACLAQENDSLLNCEHRVILPDGSLRWLDVRKQVFCEDSCDPPTPTHGILAARDITERRLFEEQLAETNERLAMALQAGGLAAWEWLGEVSVWQPELYDLLGIDRSLTASTELFFQSVHPEDLPGLKESWESATTGDHDYDHEFRIIRPNGEVRWLVGQGMMVRDEDGNVERIYGLNWDITNQKSTEEALRSALRDYELSNVKLRGLFDVTVNFAGVLDADGRVQEANQAFTTGCGYTREDVLGKLFWECSWWSGSKRSQRVIKDAVEKAQAGETVRQEVDYWLSDGTRRIVDFAIAPARGSGGEVAFLVPSGVDVTERRLSEQAVRMSEERLRAAAKAAASA